MSKRDITSYLTIPDHAARLAHREKQLERINAALAGRAALTAAASRMPWEDNPTFFRELALARLQERAVWNGKWIAG